MTFKPEYFFVAEALVPGEGWRDANTVLMREADGSYRVTSGDDLAELVRRYPKFAQQTLDEGFCNECGSRLMSGK